MNVLGIDPGTAQTAIVMWDGQHILRKEIIPNGGVCPFIYQVRNSVQLVACEHLQCFGMAVGKEVFETAYFIGRLWEYCYANGIPWQRVYRSDVKSYWCHSVRATDSNIRQAVIDRLGAPGVKKAPGITYGVRADLWSALAIAVRSHDQTQERLRFYKANNFLPP